MLRLFLENREVELSQDIQVAITGQFEDISNPTLIKNDWSKTISIPFTSNNNAIFGYIFNEDRIAIEETPRNYLPSTPYIAKEWNGSSYVNHSQPNWNTIQITGDTSYLRVNTVDSGDNILVQESYSDFGQYKFSFLKNPSTHSLEFAFINPSSGASYDGNIGYFYYNINNIENGVTYNLYFTYKRESYGFAISDFYLERQNPTAGLLDNLPYTVEKRVGGQVIDIRDTNVYFNEDKTLKILDNGSIDNDSKLSFYTAWGNNSEHLWTISNLGIGNLGDNVLLPGYIQNPRTNNIVAIGFAFNFINTSNESVIYLVKYDISSLPDGNYYLTWDYKYFRGVSGKVAGEVTHLYMTDYANVYWQSKNSKSENYNVGLYFNPLKKIDFRLEWNDSILMQGYAKLNEVERHNGNGSYEITLFGELGKLFSELKKITFDETVEDKKYLIDGSQYVDEYLNRSLIYNCWVKDGLPAWNLKKKGESGYDVTDIIGFSPNNAFTEDFKYDSYYTNVAVGEEGGTIIYEKQSQPLAEVIAQKTYDEPDRDVLREYTNVSSDVVVGNGLFPRSVGEFRSYLQLPYIYIDKLWKIFKEKAEEVTNYKFNLDSSWFRPMNSYVGKLVYMLQPPFFNKPQLYTNTYSASNLNNVINVQRDTNGNSKLKVPVYNTVVWDYNDEQIQLINSNSCFLLDKDYFLNGTLTSSSIGIKLHSQSSYNYARTLNLANYKGIELQFSLKKVDSSERTTIGNVLFHAPLEGNQFAEDIEAFNADFKYTINQVTLPAYQSDITLPATFPIKFNIMNIRQSGEYVIECMVSAVNFGNNPGAYYPYPLFNYDGGSQEYILNNMYINLSNIGDLSLQLNYQFNTRSESHITLNRLWNNEYNLFDELLKYTKMYRLGWYVDKINNTVDIKPIKTFMSETFVNNKPQVNDWTSKVDKSKDWNIKPVAFEDKYITFNYEDGKTKIEEDYKNKFGVNYGEYKLNTQYNFNESTKNLFDKIKTSNITATPLLSLLTLLGLHNSMAVQVNPAIVYVSLNESYVDNKDKDGKVVNVFGQYYFDVGRVQFDRDILKNFRYPFISDDISAQIKTGIFDYVDKGYGNVTNCSYYRKLSLVDGSSSNNMCLFNIPKQYYDYSELPENTKSIYSNFWENYLDERYNSQNKIVTCYLKLTPTDYMNFKFNQFIVINNQLYLVNKIFDYDITSNHSTKVELITVQDYNGYIS